jgi:hypothetical protein
MENKQLIYLGKSLQYFINNIKIIVYQGNTFMNLMDYLPLLKSGYCYLQDIKRLISFYKEFDEDHFFINYYKNRLPVIFQQNSTMSIIIFL